MNPGDEVKVDCPQSCWHNCVGNLVEPVGKLWRVTFLINRYRYGDILHPTILKSTAKKPWETAEYP